jgi:Cyclin-dependent kinase inhibitor
MATEIETCIKVCRFRPVLGGVVQLRREFSDKWGFDVAAGEPQGEHGAWKWDTGKNASNDLRDLKKDSLG